MWLYPLFNYERLNIKIHTPTHTFGDQRQQDQSRWSRKRFIKKHTQNTPNLYITLRNKNTPFLREGTKKLYFFLFFLIFEPFFLTITWYFALTHLFFVRRIKKYPLFYKNIHFFIKISTFLYPLFFTRRGKKVDIFLFLNLFFLPLPGILR